MLTADNEPLTARKQWLANQLKISGKLHLDEGASRAIQKSGVSLLAIGISQIEGDFQRGEVVSCFDNKGNEIARGLINYDSEESQKIMGQSSEQIESILGYLDDAELIHRDNLALL